jgi:hypothetical protein
LRGFVDNRGPHYIPYRAAPENAHRDMTLPVSTDRGRTFRATREAPWELNACAMSTDDLSEGERWMIGTWETAGQVYFEEMDPSSFTLSSLFSGARFSGQSKKFRCFCELAWAKIAGMDRRHRTG